MSDPPPGRRGGTAEPEWFSHTLQSSHEQRKRWNKGTCFSTHEGDLVVLDELAHLLAQLVRRQLSSLALDCAKGGLAAPNALSLKVGFPKSRSVDLLPNRFPFHWFRSPRHSEIQIVIGNIGQSSLQNLNGSFAQTQWNDIFLQKALLIIRFGYRDASVLVFPRRTRFQS